jgi:hypothetical protein
MADPNAEEPREARERSPTEGERSSLPSLLRDASRRWFSDPELGGLARRLHAAPRPESRAAAEAEAAVALRLLERGCTLRLERPTPSGRSCDFEVVDGDLRFYLHVKRLRGAGSLRLTAPATLRRLERIERPFVVLVRWLLDPPPRSTGAIVSQAEEFVRSAQLGDEAVLRHPGERPVAQVRILARGAEPHVVVALALADAPDDRAARMQRLMRKAHEQFMPGGENVILLCAAAGGELDLETSLLGTHIERWDRLPPRGERVAHGRADDGFWHDRRHERSRIVGRFEVGADGGYLPGRIWLRAGLDADSAAPILALLGKG